MARLRYLLRNRGGLPAKVLARLRTRAECQNSDRSQHPDFLMYPKSPYFIRILRVRFPLDGPET